MRQTPQGLTKVSGARVSSPEHQHHGTDARSIPWWCCRTGRQSGLVFLTLDHSLLSEPLLTCLMIWRGKIMMMIMPTKGCPPPRTFSAAPCPSWSLSCKVHIPAELLQSHQMSLCTMCHCPALFLWPWRLQGRLWAPYFLVALPSAKHSST